LVRRTRVPIVFMSRDSRSKTEDVDENARGERARVHRNDEVVPETATRDSSPESLILGGGFASADRERARGPAVSGCCEREKVPSTPGDSRLDSRDSDCDSACKIQQCESTGPRATARA